MAHPNRKPIRLPDYDYSTPGAYFVTICTQDRRCILSDIVAQNDSAPAAFEHPDRAVGAIHESPVYVTRLSDMGHIVHQYIEQFPERFPNLLVENYVIMPNHIHLLVQIEENGTSRTPSPTNKPLPMLISTLKRFSNKKCGTQLWQRSYHEHVIRDRRDYLEIWNYIDTNPAKWALDRYYAPETP